MRISRSLISSAVTLLAATICALAAATSASGSSSLVALVAGSSRQLYADQATVQARFPLDLQPGVSVRRLNVAVVDVHADQRSVAGAESAFTASLARPSATGFPPELVVTVKLTAAVRPATYDLLVRFHLRVMPHRKDPPDQRMAINIVVPAAQLRAPGTFTVERTLTCFIHIHWCRSHDDAPRLDLIETSGQSRLSNLRISDVGAATEDGRPTTARLDFGPLGRPIAPSGKGSASYSIAGDLKPGTAAGTFRVESNELQSAVEGTWSLRVRRSGWDLILLSIAGLAFGFVTRILLQQMINGGRARAAAGRLRRRLEEEQRQRPDPAFQSAVAGIELRLEQGSGFLRRPSTIAAAVNSAQRDLDTALKELEQCRTDAALAQEHLGRLLGARFALPPPLQAARLSARPAFDAAQRELDRERFSVALDEQEKALTTLVTSVDSASRGWARDVDTTLTALETAVAPADLQSGLTAVVARTRSTLEALRGIDPTNPEDADLVPVLRAAEDASAGVAEVKLVVAQVDRTVADVRTALGSRVDLGDVDAASVHLTEVLGDDRRLSELGAAFNDLLRALAEAIRAAAPQPVAVDELLASGRYADAARAAVPEEETSLALGDETEARAMPVLTLRLPALDREGVVTDARPVAPLTSVFANPVVVELLGVGQYVLGRLLQWALLSAVFVFLAWALFSDTFVGTSSDLAKVFLWAFALDLSGNTLVDSAKSVRSS